MIGNSSGPRARNRRGIRGKTGASARSLEIFKRTKPGDESTKGPTRVGIHPSNGISVGSYHEVEMRRTLDSRGGAIRIYGIGTVCALIPFRGPLSPHEFSEIVRFADRSKSRIDLNSRFVR